MSAENGESLASVTTLEVVEQDTDASAPDIEVTYNSIGVMLPESPIIINGKPYGFRVNHDRLANASRAVAREDDQTDRNPTMINLESRSSLPALLESPDEVRQVLNSGRRSLNVVVPAEVAASQVGDKLIAATIEGSINRQVRQGFLENLGIGVKVQRNWRDFRNSVLTVAPLAGTVTGLELDRLDTPGRVYFGIIAAAGAVALGFGKGVIAARSYDRRGIKWGQKQARDESVNGKLIKEFDEPVISLRPQRRRSRDDS